MVVAQAEIRSQNIPNVKQFMPLFIFQQDEIRH
jgi:hypothetical protein